MPQKLNVFNLGKLGVNRTKTPLHVEDGELIQSQNAHPTTIQGQIALRKRDGFTRINSSAAAGQILAIGNMPFRDPTFEPDYGLVFVIVGTDICSTSPDAITWTSRTIPTGAWVDLCWSPQLGMYCAVANAASASTSAVATSPDGITWTSRTTPSADAWKSVAWSPQLELFCAIGQNSVDNTKRAMTSPDGVTWTLRTTTTVEPWSDITWSPHLGVFLAVETSQPSNRVLYSSDGITWNTTTTGISNEFYQSVVWSPELGLFCAVSTFGSTGGVMTSNNATTWSAQTPSAADVPYTAVEWSPELGLFAAVASAGSGADADRFMTSPDGATWTSRAAPNSNSYNDVAWNAIAAKFVAVSSNGGVAYSTDGLSWTAQAVSGTWRGIV